MTKESRGFPDLTLEQYLLGELPAADADRVRAALETDPGLRVRLAEMEKSDREILDAYPPARVAERILERSRGERLKERRRTSPFLIAVPAAAVLLVMFAAFGAREGAFAFLGAGSEATRLKGGAPHLTLFRKTDAGAEEVRDGTQARQKDVLQIGYAAGEARYGVIFSVDGRGVVTFHLPEGYRGQEAASPELERQGAAVLPFAYELDDAPGFERFFLVSARSPFDVRGVERAARALAARTASADRDPLRVPGGLAVQSVVVRKPR
jgi:hypothetical protein